MGVHTKCCKIGITFIEMDINLHSKSVHTNDHQFGLGQSNKKSLIQPRSANDSFVKEKTLNAVVFLQVAEFHMKWKFFSFGYVLFCHTR